MGRKYFIKFRVNRIIPTFHSCRSKDPSTLPLNPVPSFLRRHSSTTHHPRPHRSSLKRHLFSARQGCLRSHSHSSPELSHNGSSKLPNFKWGRDSDWHVIAKIPEYSHNYDSTPPRRKIYNSAASDTEHENDLVYLPPPSTMKIRRRRRTSQKVRISTSSDSGLFSEDNDDDDQERETLVSTDSPSPRFHRQVRNSKEREKKKKNKRRSFESPAVGNTSPAPARLSEFMRKMTPCRAVADGKVRESYAVVKRSEDPYDDFKRSMVEMVVEKKMFEERELEELLRCFLSLNSEHHHQVIVRAFTEIWEGLFCQSPSPE